MLASSDYVIACLCCTQNVTRLSHTYCCTILRLCYLVQSPDLSNLEDIRLFLEARHWD
jgi:hypothetical protein